MSSLLLEGSDSVAEEEELIEAVEELVEAAATRVKTQAKAELVTTITTARSWLEWFFPVMHDYATAPDGRMRFQEDLQRLMLSAAVFVAVFFVFTPTWTARKCTGGTSKKTTGSLWPLIPLRRRTESNQSVRSGGNASSGNEEESERSIPQSDSLSADHRRHLQQEDEEETDEERFEAMWPTIQMSSYRKLVLPPTCKLVEKPPSLVAAAAAAVPFGPINDNTTAQSTTDGTSKRIQNDHADDPAYRLQTYLRHVLFFVKSMISFDYMMAGWALIQWMQGIRKLRSSASTHNVDLLEAAGNNTDEDDDKPINDGSMEADDEEEEEVGPIPGRAYAFRDSNEPAQQLDEDTVVDPATDGEGPATKATPLQGPLHLEREGAERGVLLENNHLNNPLGWHVSPASKQLPSKHHKKVDGVADFAGPFKKMERKHSESTASTVYHDSPLDQDNESVLSRSSSSAGELSLGGNSIANGATAPEVAAIARASSPFLRAQKKKNRLDQFMGGSGHTNIWSSLVGAAANNGDADASATKHRDDDEGDERSRMSGCAGDASTTLPRCPGSPAHSAEGMKTTENTSPLAPPITSTRASSPQQSQRFFFESANSKESLRRLAIEVPVPDRNGYILGDDFLPDHSRSTPLLVFVNSRSGPQQGQLLITQLRRLLNPIQVWDLAVGPPQPVLESFCCALSRLRILVCGGDGTVSWIISVLEEIKRQGRRKKLPPIAILPLGTGNDLARIYGWGGGYNYNESLICLLEQVAESYISLLDRWQVTIIDGDDAKKSSKRVVTTTKTFLNYLGVGADAQAALQVHYLRESRPDWFFSRLVNKAWYGIFGAEDLIMAGSVNVRRIVKLFADGVEIPLPSDSQGIIVLNIDSYAGGVPLWSHGSTAASGAGTSGNHQQRPGLPRRTQSMDAGALLRSRAGNMSASYASSMGERGDSMDDMYQFMLSHEDTFSRVTACDRPASCQDGMLEIVSIRGAFHLGQIKVGLSNAQRLCQCREVSIVVKDKVPVQIDGEPWRQEKRCTFHITRCVDPVLMLHRSADDSAGVETEMSKLLDWAEERGHIDGNVHAILMKEFSRRIESKTRRRQQHQRKSRADRGLQPWLKRALNSTGAVASSSSHANAPLTGGISF